MAGKARVHELAKELGVTSKEVLARLSEQGEFVKSASSTVEAPVARRLRESFGGAKPAAEKVKAAGNGSPAKAAAPKAAPDEGTRPQARGTGEPRLPRRHQQPAARGGRSARAACGTPAPHRRPAPPPGADARSERPAPRPVAPKPAARTPRVGNNPFSSAQPVDRPIPRPQAPRPGPGAPRPGAPRPGHVAGQHAPASRRAAGPAARRRPGGAAARSRWPWSRCGAPVVAPAVPAGGGNYRGGGGGGGGGGAPAAAAAASVAVPAAVAAAAVAGPVSAAVRPARSVVPAARRKRGRKSKRAETRRIRNMQAPVVGGVRLPHGNGETIRLARGASLSDFAEKIDANPASLVQALFNLGEMVTATQSVGDETLELLGSEMNYVVQVVSPEDEDRELLESFDLTYGEDEGDEEDLRDPSAGGHRHGSRRPRQDPTAGHHPQGQRPRGRGRWHHPAHRRLPGRASTSTATSGRSPSSTPRVTRRSPPCVPAVRRPPTSRSWWSPPTTA